GRCRRFTRSRRVNRVRSDGSSPTGATRQSRISPCLPTGGTSSFAVTVPIDQGSEEPCLAHRAWSDLRSRCAQLSQCTPLTPPLHGGEHINNPPPCKGGAREGRMAQRLRWVQPVSKGL